MALFQTNKSRVQTAIDSATKTFQTIVHQSTAAFTRTANETTKKATDSIDTLARQKTGDLHVTARQIGEGLSRAATDITHVFASIANLPLAQIGPKTLYFLVFLFFSSGTVLVYLNYYLKRKLMLEKHRLVLERQALKEQPPEHLYPE